jgi:hypothetical protein
MKLNFYFLFKVIGNDDSDDMKNSSINKWNIGFDRTKWIDGCWDRIARRFRLSTTFLNKIKQNFR